MAALRVEPEHSASQLAPGDRLGRYELVCPVAAGGMANVWVARPRDTHGEERLVAIKTILPKFASSDLFREMFLREGGIASHLSHKNVARIFDHGEAGGVLYIAMEYLEGDSLSKLNQACRKVGASIPPAIALRVLANVCEGLHAAHELRDGTGRLLNVVHCDVGPANIFLTPKGVPKLLDFGVANARVGVGEDTDSCVLKGKTRYMSPEQAVGDAVDRRTDVWAVGATLYHLLSGRPPYEGINPLATLRLIREAAPPLPLPAFIAPAVADVVRRCLVREKEGRYATAAQLRDALEEAMAQAKLRATVSDVAAFTAKHLSDRMKDRRRVVDAAVLAMSDGLPRHSVMRRPPVSKGRVRALAALAAVVLTTLGVAAAVLWHEGRTRPGRAAATTVDPVEGSHGR